MHTIKHTLTCQMPGMDAVIDAEQQNQSPHKHHTAQVFDRMKSTKCALKIKQRKIHWILWIRSNNISIINFSS